MSVFHQIGHDSFNLVCDKELKRFAGMICSPLNYSQAKITSQIKTLDSAFFSILDPQLYYPKSERGCLQQWEYFPSDFDTADQGNCAWWDGLCKKLIEVSTITGVTHVCSPCIVPAKFTLDYYRFFVEIGNILYEKAVSNGIGFFQTAIIDFDSISEAGEAESIASVLTQSISNSVYLIIKTNVEPRKELSNSGSITGIMKLISLLDEGGMKVLVAFCSTEFLLWKYAGASDFSTGKFFNLRRFTASRFDEPAGGGGQLPYWFEVGLLAYLRESDLVRLRNDGLLNDSYKTNPFSLEILDKLDNHPGAPWLALSWKNYLYAFSALADQCSSKKAINNMLIAAEDQWRIIDDKNVLMEEPRNIGSWVRSWRIAMSDFDRWKSSRRI